MEALRLKTLRADWRPNFLANLQSGNKRLSSPERFPKRTANKEIVKELQFVIPLMETVWRSALGILRFFLRHNFAGKFEKARE